MSPPRATDQELNPMKTRTKTARLTHARAPLTFGTFCSGIGAPETAWTPLGWRPLFTSEIDPFASAVLAERHPGVPNLGDMIRLHALLKYGAKQIRKGRATRGVKSQYQFALRRVRKAGVFAAGTPCQDFSVAGRREGFKGARGSLTFVFLQLVKIGRPDWVIFENVPGILSGDCAAGFATFLDELEGMGYVTDVDILDAQLFGVPQRRRRVFVCGQHVKSLLRTKTVSSATTIGQCLTESLLLAFGVLSGRSLTGCEGLDFDVTNAALSLQKRMRLFGMEKDGAALRLRENFDVLPRSSGCEPAASASRRGRRSTAASGNTAATRSPGFTKAKTVRYAASPSTGPSWSDTWDEAFLILNGCITSTPASGTTASKIFTCAQLTLLIAERIILSPPSSPTYLSAVSSALISLAEFTNYARSTTQNLFADLERFQPWCDFITQAERLFKSVGCPGNGRSSKSLLPFLNGLSGNPPPRREAGAGVAPSVTPGARRESGNRSGEQLTVSPVADPLGAGSKSNGGYRNDADTAANLIPIAFDTLNNTVGEVCPTLSATDGNGIPSIGVPVGYIVNAAESCAIQDHARRTEVARCLDSTGSFASSQGGTVALQPIPIDMRQASRGGTMTNNRGEGVASGGAPGTGIGSAGDPCPSLSTSHPPAIALNWQASGKQTTLGCDEDVTGSLSTSTVPAIAYQQHGSAVGPMGTLRRGNGNVQSGVPFIATPVALDTRNHSISDTCPTLTDPHGTFGDGLPAVAYQPAPIAFSAAGGGGGAVETGDLSPTITSRENGGRACGHGIAIAFTQNQAGDVLAGPVMHSLGTNGNATGRNAANVQTDMAVRILTPGECEKLQGFPPGFTRIPGVTSWRKLDEGETPEELIALGLAVKQSKKTGEWRVRDPDGPRYRSLGNSMAVPVLIWIGKRIQLVDTVLSELQKSPPPS